MLPSWELNLQLETASDLPIYRQLASLVVDRISRGLILPGAPLPGTRSLARSLGIHRNTVTAAYEELVAQGWASSTPSRGTFIAHQTLTGTRSRVSETKPSRTATSSAPAAAPMKQSVPCWEGLPDPRLAPTAELGRSLSRALRFRLFRRDADASGSPALRHAIAEMLRISREIPATSSEIMVTAGNQMGLYLVARALLDSGSVVAVEDPGSDRVWKTFKHCGINIIGIPIDGEGMQVQRLRESAHIGAVYVTPQHQFPTTVTMSRRRREELLKWCQTTGALLIEDEGNYDWEFDGPSLPLLASNRKYPHVVHLGSFSNIFAPAVTLGYVHAGRDLIERLIHIRSLLDQRADSLLETALVELIADGEIRRHIRKTRPIYQRRRNHLVAALQTEFGDLLRFSVPTGGLALWLEPTQPVDTVAWSERARQEGVDFLPHSQYSLAEEIVGGIRIGYGSMEEPEMVRIAHILRRTLPAKKIRVQ